MAVYFAVLKPGDTILGMNLAHGGHLTHGMQLNFSGKLYKVVRYGVRQDDERIDFDQVAQLAREHKPKLIVAGASAYPRDDRLRTQFARDRRRSRRAADGRHGPHRRPGRGRRAPQPGAVRRLRHHRPRTRRCAARAAAWSCASEQCAKELDSRGLPRHPGRPADARHRRQGGRASAKRCEPAFKAYAAADRRQRQDAGRRAARGAASGSSRGGTDNHLMLVDVTSRGLTGKVAEAGARTRPASRSTRTRSRSTTQPPLDPSAASASARRP